MARPPHQPDLGSRRQVEALAGYGIPEPEIAGLVGVSPKTLRKHYRPELDFGHTKANARVAENLFRKATGEGRGSVIAAIFWLKTRARWKEVSVHEHAGVPDQPIGIDLTGWPDELLEQVEKMLEAAAVNQLEQGRGARPA